jgi:hypothetical protein
MSFEKDNNLITAPKQRDNQPILLNFDKYLNSNSKINNRKIESANTNFTSNTQHNFFRSKNFADQSNSTENYSEILSNSKNKSQKKLYYKPNWKYSYYLNKNEILSLNNLNNNPDIKNSLCDYKDIDKRPKPIVYSWTKPKMVKIIENNSLIEEEVKSHFWKYSHLFENNSIKSPGKLLRILMTQLSQGYGDGGNFMNFYNERLGMKNDDIFSKRIFYDKQWKVPGLYRNNNNNYLPIKIKRPKSSYKF